MQRPLKAHGRYAYSAITRRPDFNWPEGRRLAVYLGFNIEHFEFGAGHGAGLGPKCPEPDVLNYSWRDYGNRVGVWRCLEVFDALKLSESLATPDLLAETGYRYTLNWCHDDQPTVFSTRSGKLWSIPYPQELNDIPMIVVRQMDARDFADMIVDNFDEMLAQSKAQPLVMGIALHPYIVGQPYRLRHLRRALSHVAKGKGVWFTTPGKICQVVSK